MSEETPISAVTGPERVVRIGRLLDLYGNLLTDRQRDFIRLHYEDDLSFGEIGKEFGISRQAVHDAVKHAETSLDHYESKLALPTSSRRRPKGVTEQSESAGQSSSSHAQTTASFDGLLPCIAILEDIHERLRRSGGVLYNVDGVTRDLGDALEKLRQLQPRT